MKMMMGPMMQLLLEDRFHLKIHRQTNEGPVYFLTVGRGGPKLHAFTEGSCTRYSAFAPTPLQPGQAYCRHQISMVTSSADVQGGTLDEFSDLLRTLLERPVINKTGISGRFDIRIEFSREGTKLAAIPLIQPERWPVRRFRPNRPSLDIHCAPGSTRPQTRTGQGTGRNVRHR